MIDIEIASSVELEAMRRALSLATQGPAGGENPRVGCVILGSTGEIVAEGFHRGAGTAHAEVDALTNLSSKGIRPAGLTAIVTLEPCNHHGKTGPCSQALIESGITRVVFGASDPGVESSGGSKTLTQAGIEVLGGVLSEESEALNRHWLFAQAHSRPFVTAKWAQSLDGRSAAADSTSQWITGAESRERVHLDRSQHGAIMVGTSTALIDNPSLTARHNGGLYDMQPLAVVVGHREIPQDSAVRKHPGGFTQIASHDPADVLSELYKRGISSVYLEGGSILLSAFLRAGLVDECHITLGPLLIGGPHLAVNDIGVSTMSEAVALSLESVAHLGDDIWVVAIPRRLEGKE